MTSHQSDMYYQDTQNRSPGTLNAAFGGYGLNRQTSRHFDTFAGSQSLYSLEDDAMSQYDSRTAGRLGQPTGTFSQYTYEQPWNGQASIFGSNTMGASSRQRPSNRRGNLPSGWMDPQRQYTSMPPPMNGLSNGFPNGHVPQSQHAHESTSSENEEELIPTAIVIKNIPFAVKREQLAELMATMGLPAPYAFNYHFDNGVFRGLAFANFQNPQDTAQVIQTMNHMDLQGRKLRVEYKKMLPQAERERIEREKRQRRGQLEEQHRPMTSLNSQPSISSITSARHAQSPSPTSYRANGHSAHSAAVIIPPGVDMNEPRTLQFFTAMTLFKADASQKIYEYSAPLTPTERRTIHELAQANGLFHQSTGDGNDRRVCIHKERPESLINQPYQNSYLNDSQRRGLSRAATTDFSESRDPAYPSLRNQNSGLLDIPQSPAGWSASNERTLRGAKSFAEFGNNRGASPVGSARGFPSNLAANVSRYTEGGDLSSTLGGSGSAGPSPRDDFNAAFGGLSLGGFNAAASRLPLNAASGVIGSQRSVTSLNGIPDDRSNSSSAPERQPRGPPLASNEWGSTFARTRQNGQRSSTDLDLHETDQFGSDMNAPSRYR